MWWKQYVSSAFMCTQSRMSTRVLSYSQVCVAQLLHHTISHTTNDQYHRYSINHVVISLCHLLLLRNTRWASPDWGRVIPLWKGHCQRACWRASQSVPGISQADASAACSPVTSQPCVIAHHPPAGSRQWMSSLVKIENIFDICYNGGLRKQTVANTKTKAIKYFQFLL